MTGTKSLDVSPEFKWNEPWRRARFVQRASPHLGEADRPWQWGWGWGIALGGALAISIVCLLLFV